MERYSTTDLRVLVQRAERSKADPRELSRDELLAICADIGVAPELASRVLDQLREPQRKVPVWLRWYSGAYARVGALTGCLLGLTSVFVSTGLENPAGWEFLAPAVLLFSGLAVFTWRAGASVTHVERQAAVTASWTVFTVAFYGSQLLLVGVPLDDWLITDALRIVLAGWAGSGLLDAVVAELRKHRERARSAEAVRLVGGANTVG